MDRGEEIIKLFPDYLRDMWQQLGKRSESLQEIRIRTGRPVIVYCKNREYFLTHGGEITAKQEEAYIVSGRDVEAILNHLCKYSLYAYEEELRQGFLTVQGGHRIGISGQVIVEGRSIRNIKHVSYLNIRISHQILGAADKVLPSLYENGRVKNCLLISPPGCGKTTLLRDMVRQISNGNRYGQGVTVGVVDERSEIAGSYQGVAQNDVGIRTDVLDACPKVQGMMILVRSMSPKVIAVDELGSEEDMKALWHAMQCGCKVIATVHGSSMQEVMEKPFLSNIIQSKIFECYIVLNKRNGVGSVEGIYDALQKLCCG